MKSNVFAPQELWLRNRCCPLKALDAHLNIALIHHPLEWLSPVESVAYQAGPWRKCAFYSTFDGEQLTLYPIRFEHSPRPVWTTDPSVYPGEHSNNHQKSLAIPRLAGKFLKTPVSQLKKLGPLNAWLGADHPGDCHRYELIRSKPRLMDVLLLQN